MTEPTTTFRASKLEDWEIQAAKNLKKLFVERADLKQKEFGARFGIGSPGMMSQYLTAKRPIGLAAAIKFANGLGVSVGDISPTLAAQLPRTTIPENPPQADIGIRIPSTPPELEAAVETIAQALGKMTEAERAAVTGKIGKLADAYDSAALKKSIVEMLTPTVGQAGAAFAQSGKKAA